MISKERKNVLCTLIRIKSKKVNKKICETKFENLVNIISRVTATNNIDKLTETQAEALEMLLLIV